MHISKKNKILILISAILISIILIFVFLRDRSELIDYSTYQTLLKNDLIDSAALGEKFIYITSSNHQYKIPKDVVDLSNLYKKVPVRVKEDFSYLYDMFLLVVAALFFGYLIFLTRKKEQTFPRYASHSGTIVKHQINIAQPEIDNFASNIKPMISDVRFKDVAGIDEVKEELQEIIEFLKNPKKFIDFGVRMPKGVLLVGPPGVGKTMIAKAVAGEANVPFFYQSGSAFVQIYVGMGAKRVRELFAKAKQMAPSIIFIDEIDAVGKARGAVRNDEREATLNQLLTEMDGFEDSSGVIVIGATNKIEMLDEALLRPGRFDRRVFVSLPNAKERAKILEIYLNKIPHFVDIEKLSKMCVGFSGAALASLVNEAALNALRKGKKIVEFEDFESVKDKVLYGKRKLLTFSEKEKEIQATYQAAKILCAYWYDIDFDRVNLMGGGFKDIDRWFPSAKHIEGEIISKNDFLAKIKLFLAGFVAMKIFYNEEFSNSAEDLQRAKILAKDLVERYAMGEKIIGNINDAILILEKELKEVENFIASQRKRILKIKDILIQNEMVTYEDVKRVVDEVL